MKAIYAIWTGKCVHNLQRLSISSTSFCFLGMLQFLTFYFPPSSYYQKEKTNSSLWVRRKNNQYLRWSVEKILKNWDCFKQPMWDNFNIGMPQASEKVKYQNVAEDHGRWSIPQKTCSKNWRSNYHTQRKMFQNSPISSFIGKQNKTKLSDSRQKNQNDPKEV